MVCVSTLLSVSFMQLFSLGTLNINGGRDRQKRALVYKIIEQNRLDVAFLQETHSDSDNEVDWGD